MKKKLKLKKWVKEVLIMISLVSGLLVCCVTLDKITEKGIENCTEAGHSQYYCERELKHK